MYNVPKHKTYGHGDPTAIFFLALLRNSVFCVSTSPNSRSALNLYLGSTQVLKTKSHQLDESFVLNTHSCQLEKCPIPLHAHVLQRKKYCAFYIGESDA